MGTRTEILGRVPISRGKYNETETYYIENIVLYANGSYMVNVPQITGVPPINENGNLNEGWTTSNAVPVVQQPGDSEEAVMSQKAVTENYGSVVENPEFVDVTTDADGKVLEGITVEGQKYLAKPSNQDENLQDQIDEHSQKIDEINEKIGAEAYDIPGEVDPENPEAPVEPVHVDATGIYKRVSDLEEKTSDLNHEENPEYIEVTTDAEGKVLEGIKEDGTKFFGNKIQQGNAVESEIIDNPEYIEVTTDSTGKVIEGITTNGQKYLGKPSNQDEKLQEQIDNLLGSDELQNKVDDAIAQIDEKLEDLPFDSIDNPEYADVTLDEEDKILEGITTDGEKQVNIPHTFNRKVTFNDEIEMNEKGQSSIINIIRNSGFNFEQVVDWSNETELRLPIPDVCALVNIICNHLPTTKEAYGTPGVNCALPATLEYWDKKGNYFQKPIIISAQGDSSLGFAIKNYGFDFADGTEITFGNWVPQDSFHLKAFWIDNFAGICDVGYKYYEEVIKHLGWRANRFHYATNQITAYNSTGDFETDWHSDALCHPDGFPMELYHNGEYIKLYAWNLKKHRKNYSMNKSDYKSLIFDGNTTSVWAGNVSWTAFELKNPKTLITVEIEEVSGYTYKSLDASPGVSDYYETTDKPSDWTSDDLKTLFGSVEKYPQYVYRTSKNKWYELTELAGYQFKKYNGDFPKELLDDSKHYYDSNLKHYHENEVTERDGLFYVTTTDSEGNEVEIEVEEKCKFDASNKDQANTLITKNCVLRMAGAVADINAQTTTDLKREKFLEYFDKENCILYLILSNILYNNDGWSKNWIWCLYDNKKCAPTLYDLDSIFGRYPGSGNFVYPGSVTGFLSGRPVSFVWELFKQDVVDTYNKLVEDGLISVEYIMSFVKDWVNKAGIDAYKRMYSKYNNIPSYKESTINDEYWDIQPYQSSGWKYITSASLPDYQDSLYLSTKTYNAGDYCYKLVGNAQYLKCTCKQDCTGIAPFETFGYYDSVQRIETWLKARLEVLATKFVM